MADLSEAIKKLNEEADNTEKITEAFEDVPLEGEEEASKLPPFQRQDTKGRLEPYRGTPSREVSVQSLDEEESPKMIEILLLGILYILFIACLCKYLFWG